MSVVGTVKAMRAPTNGAAEQHELAEVIVGKDVLELVSSAMYIDPMSVYREYIQNAADAVEMARMKGQLAKDEPGRVAIFVDAVNRTVRIRDNGCGIPFQEFGRRLTALGASVKRGTPARGFRGVGRLAGLGYAQEVVFRSRVVGEEKVSELRWDCRRLKASLRDVSDDTSVTELIRSVTSLQRSELEEVPERFFEVELRGIVRLRNDRLLSPSAIGEYLCQVAPVPFSPDFKFGGELTELLERHVDLGILHIHIDGAEEPLYRPHRNNIAFDGNGCVTFNAVSTVEIPGIDGELAALAWILHHDYEGALPTRTLVKGLRLRSGNVQVGDHALLEDLFPEPRFNVWSVGEVHVIDRRIVPNGRRDHFEQNAHFHNLINHLTPTARDISRHCRTRSIRRKWEREFEFHAEALKETLGVVAQGGVGRSERERLALSAEQTLLKLDKLASMQILAEGGDARRKVIVELRVRLGELMDDAAPVASPLMRLPRKQQKLYQEFFELIYECSANRIAAKALIDRILLRLE
ncbi:molecular chaperone Hsp90 [Mesorhizobium sp. M2D.F.Ca.ET.223.01.1.1]|uniref:ATP-binding protein n=1 Tax=Mesorhizobium sp. M2D.F.Ca.ET.223.01.1.1 TaxID=2563940 RepID=UPI001093285E|nr:ATP-binding protein [Mesorhizobium sp. M2D.F.Ca.ET.223.01.1.1]TGR83019.1 molecular chaperone Hsp90 [Mesorhizobium sp. M2D.F.Ca.ET.223.01.1.1]